jgi:hypothetical protein
VAIVYLFIGSIQFGWIGSSLNPIYFWIGVVVALIFAGASLSLPPLALGAREGHALKTALLSGLCFCAFVFVSFMSFATASFGVPFLSLMALVGTSAVGSLVAVLEEGQVAAPTIRATLIAGSAIWCASLFAYWFVTDVYWLNDYWASLVAGMVVAASSWAVLPGIVAFLRSG